MNAREIELLVAAKNSLAAIQFDNEERRADGKAERWDRTISTLKKAIATFEEKE